MGQSIYGAVWPAGDVLKANSNAAVRFRSPFHAGAGIAISSGEESGMTKATNNEDRPSITIAAQTANTIGISVNTKNGTAWVVITPKGLEVEVRP